MKKSLLIFLSIIILSKVFALDNLGAAFSQSDNARLWFYASLEKKIFYRQIFMSGIEAISNKVEENKLKKGSWGAIFALDNTLVEHNRIIESYPKNLESGNEVINISATPGAEQVSCEIKQLGGKVIIVTNRYLLDNDPDVQIKEIEKNLAKLNICFDSIIFARNSLDSNKNPRFSAIITGDYENVISSKKLPALNIIAYFGSDIIDFPDFKQSTALNLGESTIASFGESYFLLPNPVHGSFEINRLKVN